MGKVYTGTDSKVVKKKTKSTIVNVVIALFFDGTLNNKYNIELRIAL